VLGLVRFAGLLSVGACEQLLDCERELEQLALLQPEASASPRAFQKESKPPLTGYAYGLSLYGVHEAEFMLRVCHSRTP
jgi:hypothetical protein